MSLANKYDCSLDKIDMLERQNEFILQKYREQEAQFKTAEQFYRTKAISEFVHELNNNTMEKLFPTVVANKYKFFLKIKF